MLKAPSFPLLTSSSRSVLLQVCRPQNPSGSSFRLSVRAPVAELLNSHSSMFLGDADVAVPRTTLRTAGLHFTSSPVQESSGSLSLHLSEPLSNL